MKLTMAGLLYSFLAFVGISAWVASPAEVVSLIEPLNPKTAIVYPQHHQPIAADGHLWEGKEWQWPAVIANMKYYWTQKQLEDAYILNGGYLVPGTRLRAFTTYKGPICTIHMIDPDKTYAPEIAGHELMHCYHGDFHPNHLKRLGIKDPRADDATESK